MPCEVKERSDVFATSGHPFTERSEGVTGGLLKDLYFCVFGYL